MIDHNVNILKGKDAEVTTGHVITTPLIDLVTVHEFSKIQFQFDNYGSEMSGHIKCTICELELIESVKHCSDDLDSQHRVAKKLGESARAAGMYCNG